MKTATQALEQIQNEAASNSGDDTRFYRVHQVGDELRQGDVYLRPCAPLDPSELTETPNRQLAEGTSKGSRHILEGNVTVYLPVSDDPLAGPVFEVHERAILAHPEHANHSLARGWYASWVQVDLRRDERMRVAD